MLGRILIVDDRFASRLMLSALFGDAYYDVLQSDAADDAITSARRDRPGIAVIADGLAGSGAAALCSQLRRDPQTADILRIVITDLPDPARVAMMIHAGADEVISRNCPDDEVLARVRALVDHREKIAALNLRDTPARPLTGLREAAADFAGAATVTIISSAEDRVQGWAKAVAEVAGPLGSPRITVLSPDSSPMRDTDVLLIDAASLGRDRTLRMVARITRRTDPRSMQVLVAADPADRGLGLRALELGADSLLNLPFDAQEAAARISLLQRRKSEIAELHARLRSGLKSALTDPLTGLYNRRYALPRLDDFMRDARAHGRPAAVIMADLDRFKWVNDTFGHAAGDAVLAAVADVMQTEADRIGFAARMGGEEFLVALPGCGRLAAAAVARRIRAAVADQVIAVAGIPQGLRVTTSVGVAVAEPARMSEGMTASEDTAALLTRADRALYRAKRTGRNRVVCDLGLITRSLQPDLRKVSGIGA